MANPTGSIAGPVVGIVGPGPGSQDSVVIVGITTITGGTNGYLLFDNNGVLGEESVTTALDTLGAVQGDILYRNATNWTVLAPGTSGQILTTGGAAANPSWGAGNFTLNSGTNFGITAPGLMAIGGTYTIGATTDNLQFNSLGLGVAAPASAGQIALAGATSGSLIIKVAAVAGSNTLTFPAGTTDFSGTGGTSQYVKQSTLGGAFTVGVVPGSDVTGAALTKTDDTNVTLTLGGTPATALLRAASITAGWTGLLSVARGGTGIGSAAAGTVLTAATANTWSASATPTLGIAGTTLGQLNLSGNGSGVVTIQPASVAGTWALTVPTSGGTSGYYLQTDGTGISSWTSPAGRLVGVQVFVAAGTVTYTRSATVTQGMVFVRAGGGGGGGGTSATDTSGCGGGGQGELNQKLVPSIGTSLSVIVGAGGLAGTTAGTNGGTGGTSSFGSATPVTAIGGGGGTGSTTGQGPRPGGAGGTGGTGGDFALKGAAGVAGLGINTIAAIGFALGQGGNGGGDGGGPGTNNATGVAGVRGGGGSGGSVSSAGGSNAGGAGGAGYILVYEYT